MNKKIISILISAMFCVATFFMPVNVHAQSIYKGVDIYEYDNIYDYQQLKNDGIDVVIQKATQGLYHNDSLLFYRYTQIINYGFKIGYYHFADNSGQPIAEAQHFLGQINRLHSDTILWLDIENASNWTQSESVDYVNQFVNYVRSQGYNIGIYTGLSFYYEYLSGNIPTDIPLWLASYGKQPTQYPNLVSWQYAEDGSLNGVIGDIDLDYFNESIFGSNDYIKSIQHDLQRVGCLAKGEFNATGVLDNNTKQAIQQFRYADGLTYNDKIDSELVNALNDITKKQTIGYGWSANPNATRYFQWYIGTKITGVFDANTAQKAKEWQIKAKIWSASGADGVVREKDWNLILY